MMFTVSEWVNQEEISSEKREEQELGCFHIIDLSK